MFCYGALQEAAIYLGYRVLRDRAIKAGDRVLEAIFSLIGRDEARHAGFYRNLLVLELERGRDQTLADPCFCYTAVQNARGGLIPNYSERLAAAELPNHSAWYM
jgi:hypothetical protein